MTVILTLLPLVLSIAALIDVITRDDSQVKHLPKLVWVLLVVFLPVIGSIIWFAVGRDWGGSTRSHGRYQEPVQRRSVPSSSIPSDTERQLAELEAEIEFYEQQQRRKALEAEAERRRRPDEA